MAILDTEKSNKRFMLKPKIFPEILTFCPFGIFPVIRRNERTTQNLSNRCNKTGSYPVAIYLFLGREDWT